MASCEGKNFSEGSPEDYEEGEGESSSEESNSDDSEGDPTYDIIEETCSDFSNLTLKKSKSRSSQVIDSASKMELDDVELKVQDLNGDQSSFEIIEKIIQAGQLEKLKVEQCKVYLRKNGLRLTGNKDVLIERIREHLGIIAGGGENKYPVSSFVLNCKGDACTGDVVMFEQNVYEMYNIASRSATGPPCGSRIVAGRIVKESYGSAKQQHTFTIEVLWSKGDKPLPPLHPLLIKGRNLYRLKTMRQRWPEEEDRRKVLLEKHSRGSFARSNREVRIQEKEMRKMLRGQRVTRKDGSSTINEQNRQTRPDSIKSNISQRPSDQPQKQQQPFESRILQEQNLQSQQHNKTVVPQNTILTDIPRIIPQNPNNFEQKTLVSENPIKYQNTNVTKRYDSIAEVENHRYTGFSIPNGQRDFSENPIKYQNTNVTKRYDSIAEVENHRYTGFSIPNGQRDFSAKDHRSHVQSYPILNSPPRSPMRHFATKDHQFHARQYSNANGSSDRFSHRQPMTSLNSPPRSPHRWQPMPRQMCRFYAQGRCYYGDNCKYLHGNPEKCVHGERREQRWPNRQNYYGQPQF